jgi:flavin reductase (DIM6/NTAB) family NADH-FMN oxidoreductase RutF
MTAPDPKVFKDVLSRFASGVTVVTTMCDGVPHGLTVSAFNPVSAAPPRVLVCLGNDTDSKPLIERARCFAVHILGRDHVALGPRFAKMLPGVDDLFAGIAYRTERTGAPVLDQCLGWLDCRVESILPVGDHAIFIGAVEAASVSDAAGEPILYYRRGWRALDPGAVEP